MNVQFFDFGKTGKAVALVEPNRKPAIYELVVHAGNMTARTVKAKGHLLTQAIRALRKK